MDGLFKKLLIIQNSIDNFVKNKQAHNYSYVDGNTVLNHIRPLMNDTGLILKQEILSISNERYDYTTSKGISKTEVLCSIQMKFTWVDCESGQTDENLFGANGMNDFDKGVGSALTYGERYFLLKYFHIPTDKDDADAVERDVHEVQNKVSNNLPWLNKGTSEYNSTLKRLREKTATIKQVEQYFKLSKTIRADLEAALLPVISDVPF